jgi:hypothetical protein
VLEQKLNYWRALADVDRVRATYVRATCYQKNISCPQHKRHARFVGGDCVLREGSRHHPQRLVITITAARTLALAFACPGCCG